MGKIIRHPSGHRCGSETGCGELGWIESDHSRVKSVGLLAEEVAPANTLRPTDFDCRQKKYRAKDDFLLTKKLQWSVRYWVHVPGMHSRNLKMCSQDTTFAPLASSEQITPPSLTRAEGKDGYDILGATLRRLLFPSFYLAKTRWQRPALPNLPHLWNCVRV